MMIAVLGRRDSPTDALEDYSRLLGQAFERRGQDLKLCRVQWPELGWTRALWRLWRESRRWSGQWVLVQYTALSWSRRGLPVRFLAVLAVLKARRARVAIVFHDPIPYPLWRPIHRVRY